ncbi:extracellular solute-binding protein [Tenggerimyces flavus]|nr:extracellular solute-binding protein [Tenggerimyces flavus]
MELHPMTRRELLRGLSALAVVGAAGTACGGPEPKQASGTIRASELPSFADPGIVKPDLKSAYPGGMNAYFRYPPNPAAAFKDKPLGGGTVKGLTYTFDPVAPGLAENPLWQKVNEQIGGDLSITYAPSADYAQRFATTIASDDLPDLVTIYGQVQQLPGLLKSKFTDLSEHLAGDAIQAYPNLAGLATDSWRETMLDGSIWGIPIARPPVSGTMFARKDLLDKQGLSLQPTTFAEFKDLLTALTDKRGSRWACGDPGGVLGMITAALGVPSAWIEKDGAFTANLELEQYEAALEDTRALVAAEVFHPDGMTATNNQRNDWFTQGRTPLVIGGFVGWSKYEMWGAAVQGFQLATILPFSYDGTTKPVHGRGAVIQAMTAIKKSDPSRVKELLRLLDWLATPFGSAEYVLRNYGVENVTYTLKGTDPIVNASGQTLRLVPFKYLSDGTQVIYDPGLQRVAQARFDYQEAALEIIDRDPTLGLYSETEAAKNAQLSAKLTDARTEILRGQKPVSTWKEAVDTWRKDGGDTIRDEYEAAYAKASGSR